MCKFQFLIAASYPVNYYFISNFIFLIEMWRCKYFNAMKFCAFAIGIKSSVPLGGKKKSSLIHNLCNAASETGKHYSLFPTLLR